MRLNFLLLLACFVFSQAMALAQGDQGFRVLFIPLDDRPPCLQFPVQMGRIGEIELISPPRELLGRFTEFGQCDAIINWIKTQDLSRFDAAVVSFDMLAYGGLVASRVHATPVNLALARLDIVRIIHRANPKMKIYASSVIMRLAPTADGKNEAYREKLSKWAEISVDRQAELQTRQLEAEIPAAALEDYRAARQRNLQLNRSAIQMTQEGVIDYLILSQDDAKPRGVHVQEREGLIQLIQKEGLQAKIAVQPGADEVSMLLLARCANMAYGYQPKVKAIYAAEKTADQVMPFEDRPLRKTVSFHLEAVGAKEVTEAAEADILFFVFADRFTPGAAEQFAQQIIQHSKPNTQGIIVADVDPKGDVQGGDQTFTEALQKANIFAKVYGYACWNTAGNTIGTALPHGMVYNVAKNQLSKLQLFGKQLRSAQQILLERQTWFTMNRLLDDYTYHSLIRPDLQKSLREKNWNPYRLTVNQTPLVEQLCMEKLQPLAQRTMEAFFPKKMSKKPQLQALSFDLPWDRTFEAEIDFKLLFAKKNKP